MSYTIKHTTWFPNRGTCEKNILGLTPSSKFVYRENELKSYKSSAALMSSALLRVSDQVTENAASLVATLNSDESYTNGKEIVIGIGPMNEHDDLFDAMDILMGLACHEACHCAYTDFEDYSIDKVMEYQIGKWLSNLYEDECIEEMLIKRHKQWAFFLDCVLSHYFSDKKFITQVKIAENSRNDLTIIQCMLLFIIRQPRLVSRFPKDWTDKFGPMMDEIYENVIAKINNPSFFAYSPTSTVNKATIETIKIIEKYVGVDNMKSHLNMDLGMIGKSSSETSSGRQYGDGKSDKEREKRAKQSRTQMSSSVKKKFDRGKEKVESENEKRESSELNKNPKETVGAANPMTFDKAKYDMMKSRLRDEISVAKRIIIPNDRKIEYEMDKFHRNGQLISSHLAQAIQGVNCVYQRKVVKKTEDKTSPKYALVLALDESGSMMFPAQIKNNADDKSFDVQTKLAITFYEAMKDFKDIDIYIYGHGDNIVKYVTPSEKKIYRLASRIRQMSQNEMISYDAIFRDVRLHTNKPILFFNITDSNYLADQENIKKVIDKMKRENGIVSLMTIPNRCYGSNDNDTIKWNNELYGEDNWVHLDPSKTMLDGLRELAKIFRKNLNKYRR